MQQVLHEVDIIRSNLNILSNLIILNNLRLAVFRIGLQPVVVVGHEGLEIGCLRDLLTLLLIQCRQVFVLHAVYGLVVAVRQCVELLTTTHELGHRRLRTQGTCGLQVHIVRMESAGADNVVGVGIVPVAVGRGVVDGQQLNDFHARRRGPVHQASQITEIADAIRLFAA